MKNKKLKYILAKSYLALVPIIGSSAMTTLIIKKFNDKKKLSKKKLSILHSKLKEIERKKIERINSKLKQSKKNIILTDIVDVYLEIDSQLKEKGIIDSDSGNNLSDYLYELEDKTVFLKKILKIMSKNNSFGLKRAKEILDFLLIKEESQIDLRRLLGSYIDKKILNLIFKNSEIIIDLFEPILSDPGFLNKVLDIIAKSKKIDNTTFEGDNQRIKVIDYLFDGKSLKNKIAHIFKNQKEITRELILLIPKLNKYEPIYKNELAYFVSESLSKTTDIFDSDELIKGLITVFVEDKLQMPEGIKDILSELMTLNIDFISNKITKQDLKELINILFKDLEFVSNLFFALQQGHKANDLTKTIFSSKIEVINYFIEAIKDIKGKLIPWLTQAPVISEIIKIILEHSQTKSLFNKLLNIEIEKKPLVTSITKDTLLNVFNQIIEASNEDKIQFRNFVSKIFSKIDLTTINIEKPKDSLLNIIETIENSGLTIPPIVVDILFKFIIFPEKMDTMSTNLSEIVKILTKDSQLISKLLVALQKGHKIDDESKTTFVSKTEVINYLIKAVEDVEGKLIPWLTQELVVFEIIKIILEHPEKQTLFDKLLSLEIDKKSLVTSATKETLLNAFNEIDKLSNEDKTKFINFASKILSRINIKKPKDSLPKIMEIIENNYLTIPQIVIETSVKLILFSKDMVLTPSDLLEIVNILFKDSQLISSLLAVLQKGHRVDDESKTPFTSKTEIINYLIKASKDVKGKLIPWLTQGPVISGIIKIILKHPEKLVLFDKLLSLQVNNKPFISDNVKNAMSEENKQKLWDFVFEFLPKLSTANVFVNFENSLPKMIEFIETNNNLSIPLIVIDTLFKSSLLPKIIKIILEHPEKQTLFNKLFSLEINKKSLVTSDTKETLLNVFNEIDKLSNEDKTKFINFVSKILSRINLFKINTKKSQEILLKIIKIIKNNNLTIPPIIIETLIKLIPLPKDTSVTESDLLEIANILFKDSELMFNLLVALQKGYIVDDESKDSFTSKLKVVEYLIKLVENLKVVEDTKPKVIVEDTKPKAIVEDKVEEEVVENFESKEIIKNTKDELVSWLIQPQVASEIIKIILEHPQKQALFDKLKNIISSILDLDKKIEGKIPFVSKNEINKFFSSYNVYSLHYKGTLIKNVYMEASLEPNGPPKEFNEKLNYKKSEQNDQIFDINIEDSFNKEYDTTQWTWIKESEFPISIFEKILRFAKKIKDELKTTSIEDLKEDIRSILVDINYKVLGGREGQLERIISKITDKKFPFKLGSSVIVNLGSVEKFLIQSIASFIKSNNLNDFVNELFVVKIFNLHKPFKMYVGISLLIHLLFGFGQDAYRALDTQTKEIILALKTLKEFPVRTNKNENEVVNQFKKFFEHLNKGVNSKKTALNGIIHGYKTIPEKEVNAELNVVNNNGLPLPLAKSDVLSSTIDKPEDGTTALGKEYSFTKWEQDDTNGVITWEATLGKNFKKDITKEDLKGFLMLTEKGFKNLNKDDYVSLFKSIKTITGQEIPPILATLLPMFFETSLAT